MPFQVSSDLSASPAHVAQIRDGLAAFNAQATGRPAERIPVVILARDAIGTVVGGCLGFRRWGVMQVDFLWVAEAHRGQRIGSRLLRAAEDEAIAAGCTVATLDTFDFQARPFYERLGYRVWGTLDELPNGRVGYYLRKALRSKVSSA